jgi:hypothetical protein
MTDPADKITPRGRCYHTVRHAFSGLMAAHYREHPDQLTEASMDALHKLLFTVLCVLDTFVIEDQQ